MEVHSTLGIRSPVENFVLLRGLDGLSRSEKDSNYRGIKRDPTDGRYGVVERLVPG